MGRDASSFRGAAQKLNTTQPAISQRIAQLEREVGVRLLQRVAEFAASFAQGSVIVDAPRAARH